MNRFTHYTAAQFTPLSQQELLQPVMIMRERHDAMEERFGEMESDSARAGFIAENAPAESRMRRH